MLFFNFIWPILQVLTGVGNFGMIAARVRTSQVFLWLFAIKKNPQNEAFTVFGGIFLSKFLASRLPKSIE
jgi:hypothetical protein